MNNYVKMEQLLTVFFRTMKYNSSINTIRKSLVNHPSPHSLVAISDILNQVNVENTTLLFSETVAPKCSMKSFAF